MPRRLRKGACGKAVRAESAPRRYGGALGEGSGGSVDGKVRSEASGTAHGTATLHTHRLGPCAASAPTEARRG